MVLWIGVDDTDSLRGMCTTFLATEIIRELTEEFDLIGFPRLVRLNPNVPWKTRGNGAICLRFGRGLGRRTQIGNTGGRVCTPFTYATRKPAPARPQNHQRCVRLSRPCPRRVHLESASTQRRIQV